VVGRVTKVSFNDQTYEAVVTLAMDRHYSFPKDTSAKILTAGLLGEQYIGLEAGGDSDKLAEGGKIKTTQSAIVLENLISQFLFSKAAEGKSDSKAQDSGATPPGITAPPGISAPPGINAPAGGSQGGVKSENNKDSK
jgi:ABC-type transporter Mla subunit MlaD